MITKYITNFDHPLIFSTFNKTFIHLLVLLKQVIPPPFMHNIDAVKKNNV